jgi:RNA polymerase sigma-70 factor (ECF subfamily)
MARFIETLFSVWKMQVAPARLLCWAFELNFNTQIRILERENNILLPDKTTYRDASHVDEHGFERLYMRYYHRLYSFSMKFTHDESVSQDLVHEVFLKLWENRETMDVPGMERMLFLMTRNLCLNHVKHARIVRNKHLDLKQTREWEELYRIDFIRDEPCHLIEQEFAERISVVVNKLPERCREVFVMSRMDGLMNREIAEKLHISLKMVEKHISQALRVFRSEFAATIPLQVILLALSLV